MCVGITAGIGLTAVTLCACIVGIFLRSPYALTLYCNMGTPAYISNLIVILAVTCKFSGSFINMIILVLFYGSFIFWV